VLGGNGAAHYIDLALRCSFTQRIIFILGLRALKADPTPVPEFGDSFRDELRQRHDFDLGRATIDNVEAVDQNSLDLGLESPPS
jgi:hypothetical protein